MKQFPAAEPNVLYGPTRAEFIFKRPAGLTPNQAPSTEEMSLALRIIRGNGIINSRIYLATVAGGGILGI